MRPGDPWIAEEESAEIVRPLSDGSVCRSNGEIVMSLSEDMDKVESAGKKAERARKAVNPVSITLDALFKDKCSSDTLAWMMSIYIGSLVNVGSDKEVLQAIEMVYQARENIVRSARMASDMVLGGKDE